MHFQSPQDPLSEAFNTRLIENAVPYTLQYFRIHTSPVSSYHLSTHLQNPTVHTGHIPIRRTGCSRTNYTARETLHRSITATMPFLTYFSLLNY